MLGQERMLGLCNLIKIIIIAKECILDLLGMLSVMRYFLLGIGTLIQDIIWVLADAKSWKHNVNNGQLLKEVQISSYVNVGVFDLVSIVGFNIEVKIGLVPTQNEWHKL